MKKIKILNFILTFLLITLFSSTIKAFSVSSNIDNNVINIGEEVTYTILFDESILTSDFKLRYDNNILEYIGSNTDNIDVNNSIENKYVHILYVDESGKGTNEIKLLFKAKKNFNHTDLKIIEMNVHTKEKGASYSIEDTNNLENITKQTIKFSASNSIEDDSKTNNKKNDTNIVKPGNQNSNNNSPKTILPYAGIKGRIFLIAFIASILATIFFGYKNIKLRKIFSILFFVIVLSKVIDVKAENSNFARIYNKIYGYEKIIAVMQNENDEFTSYQKLIDYLDINSSIDKITNSNNEEISLNSNVTTGDNIIFTNGYSYQVLLYGDVNCDGKINSNDIASVIENNLNLKQLTGLQRKAANLANMNDKKDLVLDSDDIKKFKEYILNQQKENLVDELPEEIQITGISIKANPSKTSYIKGENLELTGGIITATYEDGTTSNVNMTASNVGVSEYNANKTGRQTITISYSNHTATFDVTVHNEITGISIKTNPSKTSYIKGESLELTGGIITATYEDGTTANVNMTASNVGVRGYNANQTGKQTITISYSNHTATFDVTVHNEITGISIKTNPSKTSYIKGENLELTGGIITATYEDGTTSNVNMTASNVGVSGYNANQTGKQTIKVTYSNHTITFEVNVFDYITSIKVTNKPNKTEYIQNEALDLTGMTIIATYLSGDTKDVTNSKNLSITTEETALNNNINNLTVLGKQLINIKYTEKSTNGEEVTESLADNEKIEITVSVNERKKTSEEGFEINSTNATDYNLKHCTKRNTSQGSCRFIYNDTTYIMYAMMIAGKDEENTSLYILNNNKEVLWVIDDRSYGHANSMTWNYNVDGNYIYVLNTTSTNTSIDRIDVNKMMEKIININKGTIVTSENFSNDFVKVYTRLENSSDIANNITYDRFSNKIYAVKNATKKSDNENIRLSEVTLFEENSTFTTYQNNTENIEQGLIASLTGYMKFSDKGTNAGFCMAEDYVFLGRYISETGSAGDDKMLNSYFSTGRKNYIDVFKREKNNKNIYVYTYIGTYVIDSDLIMSENGVVGELESLVYVSKNKDTNTIVLETLINTQGNYEKYLRIKLKDLENKTN